jgi:hypothetical protein
MFVVRSPSHSETATTPAPSTTLGTTPASILPDEEERPRATTTDIRSNSERRMSYYSRAIIRIFIFVDPRDWSINEVLEWFQFHKLDEYINS